MKHLIWALLAILTTACNSQQTKSSPSKQDEIRFQALEEQIAAYVTSTYEDSKGHLWFGTLEKGIANYDGNQLSYLNIEDGLPSNRVTGVLEDSTGIFWFKTGEGLCKYDGETFTTYKPGDDFYTNSISQLFMDSKGVFWVGTWGGVFQFDREQFEYFPIPYPKVETPINEDTKNWITHITEDLEGNIWFARDGYGACKYDGTSFTHFLKKDGLNSNNVTEIEVDKEGHIWFGMRIGEKDHLNLSLQRGKGGINRLDKEEIISFAKPEALSYGEVYGMYRDKKDAIWIATTDRGVFKWEGSDFKNYDIPISIMGMVEDRKGNYWLGGAGGLYKINKKGAIQNITTNGPWK